MSSFDPHYNLDITSPALMENPLGRAVVQPAEPFDVWKIMAEPEDWQQAYARYKLAWFYKDQLPKPLTAEEIVAWHKKEVASKAGRVLKKDTLQKLIEQIVAQNPHITRQELYYVLRKDAGGIICRMDENQIVFCREDGREKVVRTSGLKDRLTRARKTIAQA